MNQLLEHLESSFSKSFRGYSVEEVEQYVQQVQSQISYANGLIAGLNEKINALDSEVLRLQEAEKALIRALNLSEEAKENLINRVEEDRKVIIQIAEEKAKEIVGQANEEAEKIRLLLDHEKNQQKEQLKNDLLVHERSFNQLKEAQKLIASQLLDISKVTLNKVSEWEKEEGIGKRDEGIKEAVEPLIKKRGRPVGKKNASKSVDKKVKKKPVKIANAKVGEVQKKSPGRPKKVAVDPEIEDGLPTLGKVLEAYAKSNQFPGKIADMN